LEVRKVEGRLVAFVCYHRGVVGRDRRIVVTAVAVLVVVAVPPPLLPLRVTERPKSAQEISERGRRGRDVHVRSPNVLLLILLPRLKRIVVVVIVVVVRKTWKW
jgi:hypothetical protein